MAPSPTILAKTVLRNEAATRAVAAELSTVLKAGDIVALDGTLGAGKTAFARALINAMPGVKRGFMREAAGLNGDLPDLMQL